MTNLLCHITTQYAWEQAQSVGQYAADSLITEGFIHLSHPEQVVTTAGRFFAGQTDLLLLWIAREQVSAEIKDEQVLGHGTFPHLYGVLNLAAVVQVSQFGMDAAGEFILPTAPSLA